MKKDISLFIGSLFLIINSYSQSTYQQVYSIFQAKCSGCHNSSSNSGLLNLSGSPSIVYAALVNHNPVNPSALARGDKRISPGYPHRSFLLRKINNGLDSDNGITANEGTVMPQSPNPAMTNYEIELVRQWVLNGAPQTGIVVDTALINKFYTVGGINSIPAALAPPASNGFQVHLGKLFLKPNSETEIFLKYNLKLADTVEINRIEIAQSKQAHHFVIYKFFNGQAVNFPEGLRDTSKNSHGSADILTVFSPLTKDHVLPPTTAYQFPTSTMLDLNFHVANSSPDSILAAEVYFNIYTQPKGTAKKFMYTRIFPDVSIVIPPGDTTVFTDAAYDSSETNMWNIWIMYTHTHRYGTDYDIWMRNPDGSMGQQVYEGFYNFDYTFNQGYYDWGVEAPERHFNPFLQVNPYEGFIHRAKFYNSGTDTVRFGLTSKDEMMVMLFQYTYGDAISSVHDLKKNNLDVRFYPNPLINTTTISIEDKLQLPTNTWNLKIFDVLGSTVYQQQFNSKKELLHLNLNGGIYFYKLSNEKNDSFSSGKIMIVK